MAEIDEQFRSILGRQATEAEKSFFEKFLQSNDLSPFEVGMILQSLPEYQSRQLGAQTTDLEQRLAASDQAILGDAQKQLQSRFRQLGRPDTTGLSAAFADTAGNLARDRAGDLANFYAGGLGEIRSSRLGLGQGALSRGYGIRDERRHRENAIADYYRQLNDQQGLLRQQSIRNLQSGLLQGGIGLGSGLITLGAASKLGAFK